MKHYAKPLVYALSIGVLSAPIAYAQTDETTESIGLQNVEKVDAEFAKVCVDTDDLKNGGKKALKLSNLNECEDGKDGFSYYYYQLYSNVPTFIGEIDNTPMQGYFNIKEDAKVIDAKYGEIYQSTSNGAKTYEQANFLDDDKILYYKIFLNNNEQRVVEAESTYAAYVPLYKKQHQFIPPVGEYLDEDITKNIIDDRDVPSNVNINYVQEHSQLAPDEGIESAINKKAPNSTDSLEDQNASQNKDKEPQSEPAVPSTVAVTITETHKEPTPKTTAAPKEPKEPLTLADFKWLIILGGVSGALALLAVAFEVTRRGKKRRDAENEQRRIEEQERQHKKNLWNDAMATIDRTMADYAQKDADIANKTLFYPLIDDITHPLHVEFLEKMQKVGGIKESPFNEARIDYVTSFAQDFSRTWNNLFSTAQEVGIPWLKKKEDKERAQKLLNLVLDDGAYEGERETARENLINLINDLFEQDKDERTTMSRWRSTSNYNEDPIYDKHNVKPNNLKNSINKNLNKPIRELAQQQIIAIEGKK